MANAATATTEHSAHIVLCRRQHCECATMAAIILHFIPGLSFRYSFQLRRRRPPRLPHAFAADVQQRLVLPCACNDRCRYLVLQRSPHDYHHDSISVDRVTQEQLHDSIAPPATTTTTASVCCAPPLLALVTPTPPCSFLLSSAGELLHAPPSPPRRHQRLGSASPLLCRAAPSSWSRIDLPAASHRSAAALSPGFLQPPAVW